MKGRCGRELIAAIAAIVVSSLVAAGCAVTGAESDATKGGRRTVEIRDSSHRAGRVVEIGEGARVIFHQTPPRGSTLEVSTESAPPVGDVGTPLTNPIELDLHGGDVSTGATIEFPLPPDVAAAVSDDDAFGISYFDEAAREWRANPATIDRARGVIRTETTHFSWWLPWTWDWAGIGARVNQDVGQIVGRRAGAATCSRGQAVPGWVSSTPGITNDAAIAVRSCSEGEGNVLAVELVNNRPYGQVVTYGGPVKWGWHEPGETAFDKARNGIMDALVRPNELYVPPLGRASIGVLPLAGGYRTFRIVPSHTTIALDAIGVFAGELIERAGASFGPAFAASCGAWALDAVPLGTFGSVSLARDAVARVGSCAVDAFRHLVTRGLLDGAKVEQLGAVFGAVKSANVVGRWIKVYGVEWQLLDLFVDSKLAAGPSDLGNGFGVLARASATSSGPDTSVQEPGSGPPASSSLRFSVTGSCTTAGGVLRSTSSNFTPGGRYSIAAWYPDGSRYTALGLGAGGSVRGDGSVAWQWDCTGDPAGSYATELIDAASGRTTGRVAFSVGGSTNPGSTPAPAPPSPPPTPAPQTRTWTEQEGSLGANTFSDPWHAAGLGARLQPNGFVEIACKLYAPSITSASPDGYWYRIASAPWNSQYYAVANTFWNGDVPGQRPYTHNTDWNVADC